MSSIVNYVADGSTTEFQIPFTYISEAHVVVTIDGTATSAFTFLNSSTLQMNTAPTAGAKVQLQRVTPTGALVDFTDGSTLFETDLDLAHQQNRLIAEESKDIATVAKTTIDNNIADVNTVAGIAADVSNVSARGADVTSVADNMAEVLLADTNAATATTKAAEAVVSANTASAQATISTTKATESSASAAAALASQNAAQQARTDTDASEALALAYKNSAQTSATTATTKASEASQSATTASSQAATATQKASEASTDAGIALAQAAVATTKAAAASTSESNALSYKDTALAASSASETARAASVVAKDASQVAQTASEAARDAASASETAAATSESNAAASEGVATTQAGISTTKAGEAATSASNAASSASSAQASKDAALEALDSFDDRYLGQKTADPTVDNDGNVLVSGALYFNTTDDIMKVYDGSLWVAAYASLSGAMFGANNLSDVADAAGSRSNLGLGTAATTASTDYATAAQGALADSAIQPNDTPTFAGLNANGTVTADGLTVDATESYINGRLRLESGANSQDLRFSDTSTTDQNQQLRLSSGNLLVQSQNNAFNAATTRAAFASNGDISFYEDTGSTPKFFWDASAESLGIGTSSPLLPLTIVGGDGDPASSGSTATGALQIQQGTNDVVLEAGVKSNSDRYAWLQSTNKTSHTSYNMALNPNGGNVGIGTSSAAYPLTVNGYIGVRGGNGITFLNPSNNYTSDIYNGAASGTSDLRFKTQATERMRIDSSGNLLVGKTDTSLVAGHGFLENGTLQARRDIATANSSSVGYISRGTTDGNILTFYKDTTSVGSIGTANGYIELGSSDTGIRFYTPSDAVIPANPSTNSARDAAIDLGISSQRFKDAHFSGTVNSANFNTTSDATLKTNVETLTGSLDAVKSLRGVSFDWIENGNSEVGVIAQEVEAVLPDVVSTNDQGIKSVKYGNMVALLIEAMKEQQAQIDELKAKLGE